MNEKLLSKLKDFNQEHLIYLLNENNNHDKIEKIDFKLLNHLYEKRNEIKSFDKEYISELKDKFDPDLISFETKQKYNKIAYNKLYDGKCCVLILAAGKGSRLGFEQAKGIYNMQMPSNKSLFEYLCNRVFSLQKKVREEVKKNENQKFINIIVHTSVENDNETQEFFHNNNYFGLIKEQFTFLPCFTTIQSLDKDNGKIILESNDKIYESPNGNGGCLTSLHESGLLDILLKKEIEIIHFCSIDNPLTRILDPLFIGYHYFSNAAFSVKYIEKLSAEEPCGVFLNYKNKPYMLDYIDIPKEISCELDKNDNKLKYRAANILSYLMSTDSIKQIMDDKSNLNNFNYSYHTAIKKINAYDFDKNQMEIKNILKFELFLNTIFEYCPDNKPFILYKAKREEEFSPIKNNEGKENTPYTSRIAMSKLFFTWLKNNKISIYDTNKVLITLEDILNAKYNIEIDFKLSYDGESLIELNNDIYLQGDSIYIK